MNDTINPANTNHSKSSVTAMLSNVNDSQGGRNRAGITDSSGSEEPFQDSIRKAYDDSLQESDGTETESSGKDLPVLNNSPDPTADDGHLLSMADFNSQINLQSQISGQLQAQNMSTAQVAIVDTQAVLRDVEINVEEELNELPSQASPQVKTEVNAAEELNMLSSPVRQLLKIESRINTKNNRLAADNTVVTINNVEKTVIQQQEISQLNVDQIELPVQKGQLLTAALQQQQMLANSQTSLLPQTASATGEFNNDGLPLLLNPSANNFSTMNLQSIPQAEIVETFARPAWSQGMGKQILWMVNQNIKSAEIRLNPAHLGPIEMLIDMSEDQVNVSLSSRHAIVREAMEQALPKLREMLDDNGFNLAETDISQHSFAEQREQNTENNNSRLSRGSTDQLVSSEISEQTIKQTSESTGMVDYYI